MSSSRNDRSFFRRNHLTFLILFSLTTLASLGIATTGMTAEVTLAWDANTEDDLAGYRVYGHVEGDTYDYTAALWDGTATSCTLSELSENTTYYFVVRAYDTSDNESADSNEVSHTTGTVADPVNQGPVADAGSDQTVDEGSGFTLDGSASSDPDGSFSYLWAQTAGTTVTLSDSTAAQPTGTAPDVDAGGTTLTFQLTVTDDQGATSTDTCNVTVNDVEEPDTNVEQPVTLVDLEIDGPPSVIENGSAQLTATASFSDGSSQTVTESVTWSDNSPFAAVTDDGMFLALEVDGDEAVTVTGSFSYENVTETLQKSITILDELFTNLPPATPTIVSPYDGQMECGLQETVTCESFSDPDGDVQGQTQWQISSAEDFSIPILDVTSADELTEFVIPHMVLDSETTYYVRVRFYDVYLEPSEWSEPVEFTTTSNEIDTDGNGISDENDVDYTVDLDGNGVSDLDEPENIKTVSVGDDELLIGISTSADTAGDIVSIESVAVVDPSTIDDTINRPDLLDFGLLAYRLRVTTGATVKVRIYFSEEIPAGRRFFMFDSLHGWWDYTENVTFHDDGRSITVSITDGGSADSDGVANGIIVDPGGIGESSVSSPTESISSLAGGSGGGGGCFVGTLDSADSWGTGSVSVYCPRLFHKLTTPVLDIRNVLVHNFGMPGTLMGLLVVGTMLVYFLRKETRVHGLG